ncbi:MAG TPA: ribulose-phosphate 3-epimerase [Flavobacteriales bacterium]|nr:ribulose-phosphate 3-epimerase [Flavobacteriales bacterium]
MNTIVAPSLLSCDFSRIKEESEMLNRSQAEWFHLDVMDGVFVPNISFGLPIIKAFRKHTDKILDVHAMIQNPDDFIEDFKAAGTDILTVHYEACTHLHRTIQKIKSTGMKAGVALNPHTPISLLKDVLKDLDMVLIMSVNPGFGGQPFIEGTYDKVRELKQEIDAKNLETIIQVDGGVNTKNASALVAAGATALVAGSAVYKSEDPMKTIEILKNA